MPSGSGKACPRPEAGERQGHGALSCAMQAGPVLQINGDVVIVNQWGFWTPFTMAVAPSLPGIFAGDGSGRGQGLIFNQDGTANSTASPAAPGSVRPAGLTA
jgi:hypothetical protein